MSYSDSYDPNEGVAIIGLAGRFPGARDVDELWRNLLAGRETIATFSAAELEPGDAAEMEARDKPGYVRARGILDDVELFDAGFFGVNPREAEVLDPQQRVFLEVAWEALEACGHEPKGFPGAIGVFAGMSNNYYFLQNLLSRADVTDVVGWLTTMMANEKDYLATRVSYKLDLRGPALNVQTACSTSLVAVCSAVQSLTNYQCDLALAGGVSITLPQRRGYLYQEGAITSPDGHCRPFDERAAGTVFGNGVGIVALRRLRDAVEDGDTIYAVIKGAGLNNDGSSKVSFTAPSVDGHAGVISLAQALAGIDPETISYVEAHGTATPLGDPVEIAGLTQAFRAGGAGGSGFCGIGSVKGNIGHLDAAAGVAGLIKTALALHHRTLPASLHFRAPSPKLDLERSPFRVVASPEPWVPRPGWPRRAGVSSFGVGGTNAHVVLEEAPEAPSREAAAPDDGDQLLLLSARSAAALDAATARLGKHLAERPTERLADVAFTLQTGRRRFSHRRALVARGAAEAAERLAALDAQTVATGESNVEGASIAFLFPGQGSQSVGMAGALYQSDPNFRADVDAGAAVLRPLLGFDLRDVLYPKPGGEAQADAERRLVRTAVTQPALFVIEHSLALAWARLGVEPAAMIGHSVGEYVAACLAGTFTRDDALRLVAERGRLMDALPGGSMLAVRATADVVRSLLPTSLEIAAENAPALTVVSGETAAVAAFEAQLAERGVPARVLATSHAFHSSMMEPILADFARLVASIPRSAPRQRWISGLTGDWITDEQAQSTDYWAQQLRRPVRFAAGLARLLQDPSCITLEVGPGHQLTTLARQGAPGRAAVAAPSASERSILHAAGQLWIAGATLDFSRFHPNGARRVPLPTYPFERKRYWVDRAPTAPTQAPEPRLPEEEMPATTPARKGNLVDRLRAQLADLSGVEAAKLDPGTAFLDLGLDSLFLTQAALQLSKSFGVKVTFRQLLDELSSIDALAAHLDAALPPEAAPAPAPAPKPAPKAAPAPVAVAAHPAADPLAAAAERLTAGILDVLRVQLDALRVEAAASAPPVAAPPAPPPRPATDSVVAFGPYRPPARGPAGGLTPRQSEALRAFVDRYTARTARSKQSTAANRAHLADPRSVAGFRMTWKETVYPIVTVRSSGSRLWDVDGNEYVDLTNGFGMIFFGHNPPFVRDAVKAQLDEGYEIGPQTPLAGEVAARVAKMVGMDRVAFCNTGSEAVTAAIRLARTVSGREKIAVFAGAYHGIFDEVLVRPAGQRSMPIAPGIPPSMVDQVVILDYGSPSALEYMKAHGGDLAAVLVEPVQSRRPELQPREFLHEVRRLTEATGTALVFDEVVTGFRTHPGGAQALFGVRADIATYGKVIGGGLPIGLVAGRRQYLDALDGGAWSYGDDSVPEVGVTFFAGTFVRHPLALAAARAVVRHLEEAGPGLQRDLNLRTTRFAAELEADARRIGAPVRITHFSSWLMLHFPADVPNAALFYAMMRSRGVHVWEGRCWFLTTAHTDADLELVRRAFRETLAEMQAGDLLPGGLAAAPAAAPPAPVELPLTEPQREMWLAATMSREANCSFNQCYAFTLRGPLRLESLKAALDQVVARHDGLRVTIAPDGSAQRVRPPFAVELPLVDLSGLDPAARQTEIDRLLETECGTPFDLAAGPLLRARVVRESADRHRFVLTAHHIVCDGWSSSVLFGDLGRLYAADCVGIPAQLPPAASYQRYVAGETSPEHAAAAAADEDYWAGQFPGRAPVLELPLERPRPPVKTYPSAQEVLVIDGELYAAVKKTGLKSGATLFATLLAAFEVLVYRLSGQLDFVVGIPLAGQLQLEDPALVAHCVSTVPLHAELDPAASFVAHLRAVRQRLADAQEHGRMTFGSLLARLDVARDRSRTPLVALTFNIDKLGAPFDFGELAIESLATPKRFSNFELMLNAVDSGADLRVECDHNLDLFSSATIRRWLSHYRTLLRDVVARPDEALEALALLDEADERQLLVEWNDTAAALPAEKRLHRLFEAQVRRTPDAEALIDGTDRISYAELDARANRLGLRLRELGVGPEKAVGVCLERRADLIVALLAVLKAGGFYVPLDPAYPRDRIEFMLSDSRARALVTTTALAGGLGDAGLSRILLDAEPSQPGAAAVLDGGATETNLAYVIYTSGSTGVPKGVAIEHRSAGTLLHWARSVFTDEQLAGMLASTSVCFDLSIFEIFLPLAFGGRVILAPNALELGSIPARDEVTLLNSVPSAANELVRAGALPRSVATVCLAGEPLSTRLVDELYATGHVRAVYDLYGPSEDTTYSTWTLRQAGEPPTIGRPIANTQAYVLNPRRVPVPIGVVGELYLAGDGLARGYLHREALTAERFVSGRFGRHPVNRAYRTGDLARYRPDGNLEFLGRADHQVKIRGFRVELGEIETALAAQPGVREACVLLREDSPGDRRLVAYVAIDGDEQTVVEKLRAGLRERLPDYMVPSAFVRLAALPLTPNRKIDRKALPAPQAAQRAAPEQRLAPRTSTEARVAAIFGEVLATPVASVEDNFFDLGGHSLTALRVLTAIRTGLGVELSLRHLFERPTVAGLAEMVDLTGVGAQAAAASAGREEVEI